MYVPEVKDVPNGLPWLISFPRTGSHWLRAFLEIYFDQPMLTRHFFEHDSDELLLMHDHDMDLKQHPNGPVVYLHRGPIATVYSELTYHHGPGAVELSDDEVDKVAEHYLRHLRHWMCGGAPREPEQIVAYEWLLDDPSGAFAQVVRFLGGAWDEQQGTDARAKATHGVIRERNPHDMRIIDDHAFKQLRRDLFRYRHGVRILDRFRSDDSLREVIDPRLLEIEPSGVEAVSK